MIPAAGPATRPLLYPVAVWNGHAPTHAITCLAINQEEAAAAAEDSNIKLEDGSQSQSSNSSLFPPSHQYNRRTIMTGSTTGELVAWESRPGRLATDLVARVRPRALCFHAGATTVTALTAATLGSGYGGTTTTYNTSNVFVSGSSEGFLSVWSAPGGRCRRSALVLPFAPTSLIPFYSWTRQGPSPSAPTLVVSASPPSSPTRSTCYVVCSSTASSHLYIVRLPRLQVVAILGARAPVLAVAMSTDPPPTSHSSAEGGQIISPSSGPFLTTLDTAGLVCLWKLSDYVQGRSAAGSTSNLNSSAINTPPRSKTPPRRSSIVTPSSSGRQSPPLPVSRSQSAEMSVNASQPTLTASAIYISNGVPFFEVPHRMFILPVPLPDNLMPDDPLLAFESPQSAVEFPGLPTQLPSLEHTALAISPDSKHLLIVSQLHFMILSTQHAHLELPIQCLAQHLDQTRAQQSQHQHHHHGSRRLVLPWSDTDILCGCEFLSDQIPDGSGSWKTQDEKRFVVWSEEGGIWIFTLDAAAASAPSSATSPATPLTNNSVIMSNPPLSVTLFAVCHLYDLRRPIIPGFRQRSHDHSAVTNTSLLVPSSIRIDGHRIIAGNIEGTLYQYLIPFAAPPQTTTERSISPSSSLYISSEDDESSRPTAAQLLSSHPDHYYDPATSIWHIHPTQVVSISAAFQSTPVKPMPLSSESSANSPRSSGTFTPSLSSISNANNPPNNASAPEPEPETPHFIIRVEEDDAAGTAGTNSASVTNSMTVVSHQPVPSSRLSHLNLSQARISRTRSLDTLSIIGSRSASSSRTRNPPSGRSLTPRIDEDPNHSHYSSASATPGIATPPLSRSASSSSTYSEDAPLLFIATSGELAPPPIQEDVCTTSCLLVDARRKQVMVARGFRSGAIHLVNLCGPVHGTLSSSFSPPSGATAARLEIPTAHSGEISCMVSLEKRQSVGDAILILLVSGSVDGTVCTWEMQSGRLLHTFVCGYAVLSIHPPITTPTIHALVQAQKAGLLYPSTSDRVPASHQIPVGDPANNTNSNIPVLNADLFEPSALTDAKALDYDSIYRTPPNELLFIVCADRSIRSVFIQAHENSFLISHLQSSPFAPTLNRTQLENELNRFVQIYRGGHSMSMIQSVFYNSFTADHDLLISQTEHGALYVFTFSTGDLEQVVDEPTEIQTFLQNYDLVKLESQLSLMAYQLRQLAAFAPGLFQLATDADISMRKDKGSKNNLATLPHPQHHTGTLPTGANTSITSNSTALRAISFAKLAMKRVSVTLGRGRRRSSAEAGGLMPGSSSLGSCASYMAETTTQANQNHILGTYILNRFLFHQQNPAFNASILNGVMNGLGTEAGAGAGGAVTNGTAAIVYRPSLLRRSAIMHGAQSIKGMELHPSNTLQLGLAGENKFDHLQLSVYALDMQQLNIDILTRYAALASSTSHHVFSRSSSLVISTDPKKEGQIAWHSLLAMLFDWGRRQANDPASDEESLGSIGSLLKTHLNFHHIPSAHQSFAVFSDRAQAVSILFPSHTHSHRRWSWDPEATALHLLSVSSILHSMLAASDSSHKTSWDKVMNYYHSYLPRQLPGYVEGDLTYFALYALNSSVNIHLAARTLLQGVIERSQSSHQRLLWWKEWCVIFQTNIYTTVPNIQQIWQRNLFSLNLLKHDEISNSVLNLSSSTSGVVGTGSPQPIVIARRGSRNNMPGSSSNLFSSKKSSIGSSSDLNKDHSGGMASTTASLSPPNPFLSEFVTDKELMSCLVLTTLFIYETNAESWRKREEMWKGASGPSRNPASTAASSTPSVNLSEMTPRVPLLVHTLLRQLAYGSSFHGPIVKPIDLVKTSLACELLTRGLREFLKFIPIESLPLVIRRLQYVSLNANIMEKAWNNSTNTAGAGNAPQPTSTTGFSSANESSPILALHIQLFQSSRKLLLEIGKYHPDLYMFIIGKEILLKHIKTLLPLERSNYMMNIVSLVRKYPRYVSPVLLDTVHTIIKMLHPSDATIRAQFLTMCVEMMRSIDSLFPTVSFHEASAKFAIGTGMCTYHTIKDDGHSNKSASSSAARQQAIAINDPTQTAHALIGTNGSVIYRSQRSAYPYAIIIFDLKTAGKWRVLEGHQAEVTAVSFHPSGTMIASYCATDLPQPTVRIWKLGESGFMSDILHSHGKQLKCWNLTKCDHAELVIRELHLAQKQAYSNQQRKATSQQSRVERAGGGLTVMINATPATVAAPPPVAAAGHHSTSSMYVGSTSPDSDELKSLHHRSTTAPHFDHHSHSQTGTPGSASPPRSPTATAQIVPSGVTNPQLGPPNLKRPTSLPRTMTVPTTTTNPMRPTFNKPMTIPTHPTATSISTPLLPSMCVSSVQLDEDDETSDSILKAKMMSARLKWSTNESLQLIREDGTTQAFEFKP